MDVLLIFIELVITFSHSGVEYVSIPYDTLEECVEKGLFFQSQDPNQLFQYVCEATVTEAVEV